MVNVLSALLFVSAYSKGHNEIDYEHGTNKELSFQFGNETQDKLIIDGLVWLGGR